MNIHKIDIKLKNLESRINEECSEPNKEILNKYKKEMASRGLSDSRMIAYIEPLYVILKTHNKPLINFTTDDIKCIVADIERKDIKHIQKHSRSPELEFRSAG